MGKIIKKLLLSVFLAIVFFAVSKTSAQALTITWDGGGSTNDWSECANWDNTNTCPGASDTVVFSGTSTKNSTVDASFTGTITTLNINSGYTGTLTLARSLSMTSNFSQAAGTFAGGAQTMDIDGTFSLTAGTFTAPTSLFVGSTFTISGSPTFNHNSGTVTFDTSAATLTCNSVTFNLVAINTATVTNQKTVATSCTFPLGANPTITRVSLSGVLSGSGTLTVQSNLGLNSNSNLSGFTGIVTNNSGAFVLTTGTFDFTGYTTIDISGLLTLSSGTMIASSGTMNVGGINFTGGTFTHNSGTININQNVSSNSACNNQTFNLVTITHTSNIKTIGSDCSLPLGANPNVTGRITLTGTLSGSGTLNLSVAGTNTFNAGATFSGFSGVTTPTSSTFTVAGATMNFSSYTTFNLGGSMTVSSGSFTAPTAGMTVTSLLTLSGGTFTASSGTTTFTTLTVSGSPTFNHNSGTVSVRGSTATLQCGNITFNVVDLSQITGTKTISSDCSFPLGANPTIGAAITLSGTLSGSGTVTSNSTGVNTFSSGATLTGFTGWSQAAGTFTVAGATLNLGSYTTATFNIFTMSSGTFTAPSGTMTVNSTFTLSGGVFNANSGTLNFNGSAGGTLTCNSATFNLVTFTHSAGTKSVSSDCNMPLGANPTITGFNVTVNGTLSGSGTLSHSSAGSLQVNSGGALSGFSGYATSTATFTLNGGTVNFGSYTTADFHAFFIFSGTFTAPTGTMTVSSTFSITAGTFNANSGTVTFDGGTATLSCNNITFNLVTFNYTTASKTVSSNCTLPLGSNPNIGADPSAGTSNGQLILNGTLTGTGTINYRSSGQFTLNSGAVLSGFSGFSWSGAGGTFLNAGATLDFGNYSPVTFRRFTMTSGSFTAPSGTMTINNTLFSVTGGTFIHNHGTVVLGDGFDITIVGSTTFNNLTKIVSSSTTHTLTFTAGSTQTIDGTLTLKGTSGNLLSLRSSSTGTQWNIIPRGDRIIEYVDVQDSANLDGRPINGSNGTITDSGNNTGWIFSRPEIGSISLQNREYVNTDRVTFTWTPPTNQDSFNRIDHYKLEVDNGDATKNFSIDTIPANRTTDYETSTYIAHYEHFDDSDLSNNRISVTTKHSDDWGQNQNNDGRLEEGERGWSLTVVDNAGGTQQYHQTVLVDRTAPGIDMTQINAISFKDPFTTSDTTPTFFGKVTDRLVGTPTDHQIAAGPNEIRVKIEKQQTKNRAKYDLITEKTVPITENFWTLNGGKISDYNENLSAKFSPFSFTPEKKLGSGTYRIIFTGVDKVGNAGGTIAFQIRVNTSRVVFLTGSATGTRSQASGSAQAVLGVSDELKQDPDTDENGDLAKVEITQVDVPEASPTLEDDTGKFSETEMAVPADPAPRPGIGGMIDNMKAAFAKYWFLIFPIFVFFLLIFLALPKKKDPRI